MGGVCVWGASTLHMTCFSLLSEWESLIDGQITVIYNKNDFDKCFMFSLVCLVEEGAS